MKPASLREKLHSFIDVLPTVKIDEIYYVLANNYREEFSLASVHALPEDEISEGELGLVVQQLLA